MKEFSRIVVALCALCATACGDGARVAADGAPAAPVDAAVGAVDAVSAVAEWAIDLVDDEVAGGCHAALALDSMGRAHIAYQDSSWNGSTWINAELRYATNASGSWAAEVVETPAVRGHSTSIALGADDSVHISYLDWSSDSLRYISDESGEWLSIAVDSWVQYYNQLALDGDGIAHLAYYRGHPSTGHLTYATNRGEVWNAVTVDGDEGTGSFASMALDGTDNAHISYYAIADKALRHAIYDGAAWLVTTVDSEGTTGWFTSTAVDGDGRSHISYSNLAHELRYAADQGGAWTVETVDATADGVDDTSLVVRDGVAHIAYTAYYPQWPEAELRYATRRDGAWVIATVEADFQTGYYPSMVIDQEGTIHIAYCNGNRHQLRYARRPAPR